MEGWIDIAGDFDAAIDTLERRVERLSHLADTRTERVWRLYMAGSARGFALGRMGLAQSLLAKPRADGTSRIPPTHRDLYRT